MDALRCALRSGAGAVKWADLDAALTAQRDRPVVELRPSVTLEDAHLWREFDSLCNEMIVTRAGRRMFPLLSVGISGLEPSAEYSLLLELRPMDECRWKFCNGRWTSAAAADMLNRKEQQRSVHVHHSSPSGGSKWMSASGVVFAKVKLSNKEDTCPSEKLVLRSMHKYQPYVHIVRLPSDERETVRIFTFAFAETQFVAVTAYQNDKITQMKIKHNPFAKAFLESQVRDQSGEEGNEDTCTPLPEQQTSPQTQPSLHSSCHNTQAEYSPDSSSLPFHSCMHSLHSNTPLSHSNYLHQNGSQVLSHLNYPLYSPRHHLHQQQDGAFTGPGVNMLHWVPIPQASVLNNSGHSLYIL